MYLGQIYVECYLGLAAQESSRSAEFLILLFIALSISLQLKILFPVLCNLSENSFLDMFI